MQTFTNMVNNTREEIQDNLLELIPSPCHGLVNVAPRVGKTRLGINIIKRDKPKSVLWVTPSVKLIEEDIPSEFKKWKATRLLKKVQFSTYMSLDKVEGEFDLVILDEYQFLTLANSESFFKGNLRCSNIIGLSGTHPKDNDKLKVLKDLDLEIVVKLDLEEAVEKGLVADYNIRVVTCQTNSVDKNIKAGTKDKPFYQTERQSYTWISNNIHRPFFTIKRMRLIYDSKTKENTLIRLLALLKGQRNLVFCTTKGQADRLGGGNSYHSGTNKDKLNAFIKKEIDSLFCVNAGGTGFTYEGIDNLILLQATSDNTGSTSQKLTRTLLEQGGEYKGNIWIICLEDTKDYDWLRKALEGFNQDKIKYVSIKELEDGIKQASSVNTQGV